jgi:glycerophosphoryl diester phosphodiesterase
MFAHFPQPAIFAHRGASAHAPENTLAAFNLAIRQGADAIELDAKLSADMQAVVIHDQTVDRTTDGAGKVNRLTLAQLRKLDAGSFFDIAYCGEMIPTLEEVLQTVGFAIYTNIELTNYASPLDNLPEKAAGLVKRLGLQKRVLFSSFNPLALLRIHRLLPDVPIGLLAFPGRSGAWARSWLSRLIPHQALHPEAGDVTAKLIKREQSNQRKVFVWTVNDPEDMHRLFSLKVDGIFTDDPQLARYVLANGNEGKQRPGKFGSTRRSFGVDR